MFTNRKVSSWLFLLVIGFVALVVALAPATSVVVADPDDTHWGPSAPAVSTLTDGGDDTHW